MNAFTLDFADNIRRVAVAFVPMLFGIICHEVAHGWAAWKLGDPTAKSQGRLTLNPLPHLDATGSLLFVLTALTSPFILGWAKPVPVEPRYFRNPRQGMMLVSFAGPLTNFIVALGFAFIYNMLSRHLMTGGGGHGIVMDFALQTCAIGVWVNVTLGWFNLLPIPPLDGSHILGGLLPWQLARQYYSIGRYGIIIVVVLLGTGMLRYVMKPLVDNTVDVIAYLASLPTALF